MGGIVIVDSVSSGTTDGANKNLSNLTVTGEAKFKAPALISSDADNGLTSGSDDKLYIDVSGKANVDLDNITSAGTSVITSLIASNITGKANVDLDNLSVTGQAVIDGKANVSLNNLTSAGTSVITSLVASGITGKANVDLSNLTVTGEARFTAKAGIDLDNISSAGVSVIQSYATGGGANTDLSNLSVTGQAVIDGKANTNLMNTNFITNGILSAPNGVATYNGLELQLPAGTVLACPNGINADGTRKSIVVTTASLLTATTTAINGRPLRLFYNQSSNYLNIRATDTTYYYEQPTTPTGMSDGALWYNNSPSVNKCYMYDASTWNEHSFVIIADFSFTGGAISDFNAVYPVELVKKNDSNWIARQGKPSNRYVDLTLGASGATYTMQYTGFINFGKVSSASGQYARISNNSSSSLQTISSVFASGYNVELYLPVKVGDIIRVNYDLGGATTLFRNIADEGVKNV